MTLQRAQDQETQDAAMSMDEIRLRKGMPFEEFCEQHPWWEWTESRLARRLIDEQGRAWVPMWNPDPGVGICYDPELTPAAEAAVEELVQRSIEYERQGGKLWDLDELDALEGTGD